jgi:competence protein ComFC
VPVFQSLVVRLNSSGDANVTNHESTQKTRSTSLGYTALMVAISPRKLTGKWTAGYALDLHTTSSTYLGDDQYGHAQFDTTRSEMGELLYRLKYEGDKSVIAVVVETAADFIRKRKWAFDLVIPVPPSRTRRASQPVIALSKALAIEVGGAFCPDCIVKVKDTPELKDVYEFDRRTALLKGAYAVARNKVASKSVLVFDDLYRSGATLNSVCQALMDKGKAKTVYALTLTMTRSHR